MSRPVTATKLWAITATTEEVGAAILDLSQWPTFTGWGPMPGIREAEFLERAEAIVGTRIGVTNTDGSRHVETITAWDLPRRIELWLDGFPRPLSWLATHFVETWDFEPDGEATWCVERRFEMRPRSWVTRPMLVPIAWMMRKAVARHITQIGATQVR
ncbi:MAG: SRPBCC family protein [Planctomycetota bacterium]